MEIEGLIESVRGQLLYCRTLSSRIKLSSACGFHAAIWHPLPFTRWHRLEVRNAMRLAVFHRAIESIQAKAQLGQL